MGEEQVVLDGKYGEKGPKRLETLVEFQVKDCLMTGMVYTLNDIKAEPMVFELERRYMNEDRHHNATKTIHSKYREKTSAIQTTCINILYKEGYTLQGEMRSVKGISYFRSALELMHLFRDLTKQG